MEKQAVIETIKREKACLCRSRKTTQMTRGKRLKSYQNAALSF
jgi:hypothetical protein